MKYILSSLLVIILITICIIFFESKKLVFELEDNVQVLINTKIYNTDLIKNIKNGELISQKEIIQTNKVGEKTITFKINDFFGREKKYNTTLNVYDDIPPIIKFNKELVTEEGVVIDLMQDVEATDNSNEKVDVTIIGEYDFNKPGTYSLIYYAKDSSNNETKENFILNVNAKKVVIQKPEEITFSTSKGFTGTVKDGLTYIDGILIVNKSYTLPKNYGSGITSETKSAFAEMQSAAQLEGLNIYISSGFRSYNTQKTLYNNYVKRDGESHADTYSARPGHSEHQSGLAFDVNIIDDSFHGTPEAIWLANNCYKYGFILRYPQGKTAETGYKYEPWHFRYVGIDLANKLYNNGDWLTLESYFGITSEYK